MRLKTVILRALPLVYFLALSLPHHPFSRWLDAEFIIPYGFETMQLVADIGSYALLFFVLLAAMTLYRRLGQGAVYHIGLWILVGFTIYAADRTLIVNNIERIHYPEYALMALLFNLSVRSENLVFLASSFAGIADEFLQFSMDPQKTGYLDFNDIVLNTLGAGLGVAIIIAFRRKDDEEPSAYEKRFRGVSLAVTAVSAGLALMALAVGRVIPVVDTAANRSVISEVNGKLSFILGFERHEDLWIKSDYGKVFHILSPIEGTLSTGLLLALFFISFYWLKSRKKQLKQTQSARR